MSKTLQFLLIFLLLPVSVSLLGCGGDDQPRVIEEERPGQFRELAEQAMAEEDDSTER